LIPREQREDEGDADYEEYLRSVGIATLTAAERDAKWEATIAEAKGGDVGRAVELLQELHMALVSEYEMAEPVRRYFAEAVKVILRPGPRDWGTLPRGPVGARDYYVAAAPKLPTKKDPEPFNRLGDANEALNIANRSRRPVTAERLIKESYAKKVLYLKEHEKVTLDRAFHWVAEREHVAVKTVQRAWAAVRRDGEWLERTRKANARHYEMMEHLGLRFTR
jgi:hypothetical protein